MRLLLTSEALANNELAGALEDLANSKLSELSVAYVPTSAHRVLGDKSWLMKNLISVWSRGFRSFDIVELAALDPSEFTGRLSSVDVIVMGGGDSHGLMDQIEGRELTAGITELIATRVYVATSAGALCLAPDLAVAPAPHSDLLTELRESKPRPGLGMIDFYFRPHLNDPFHETSNEALLRKAASSLSLPIYAADNESGFAVVDGSVTAVGTGRTIRIEPGTSNP